ncbi:hypothetical protein ES703_84695 [subsurface metagenome]
MGQHAIVEEVSMCVVGKSHAVLGISIELIVNAIRAVADVFSFKRVLSIPGMEAPQAVGVVMGCVPVFVGPIRGPAEPIGEQIRDEVVDVQLLAQRIVFGEVGWV